MLTEQRRNLILGQLEKQRSVTVAELKDLLQTSESTIRRDIIALDEAGKLVKVFGGAVSIHQDEGNLVFEPTVAQKTNVFVEEKKQIAAYGASLIEPGDFVFLDAGTTVGAMVSFIKEHRATYVTNAVATAQQLAARGFKVFLIGGELKTSTEAVIGNQALLTLQSYHFTKGFFGTNGVNKGNGFMTPDPGEAEVKKCALAQCKDAFFLADASKFGVFSSVTFAPIDEGTIITNKIPPEYGDIKNIVKAN